MNSPSLDTVELKARKERSSIGMRLSREAAEARRSELEADGWTVAIDAALPAPDPRAPHDEGSGRQRRRRLANDTRVAAHTRTVRDHLRAAWKQTEVNRRALERLRSAAAARILATRR